MAHDRLFHQVLDRLSPTLDTLAPPPEGGWLRCAYDALCNGLFPDPAYMAPGAGVRQGLALLIPALDKVPAKGSGAFDPLSDLLVVAPELRRESRVAEEYDRLLRAVDAAHFLAALRLGREVMPFDPASHTIGVHNMAVHTALQARAAGLPVDVALVSGAALCHDIGKFGCRGEEANRVPHLHYYYTWQWLTRHGLWRIAQVSANHATWDLEFDNLPLEALLLIYADYRVRGVREAGGEVVRIYPLSTAYKMIMAKLLNVTPEKTRRYRLAYARLRDFESYLHHRGVGTELTAPPPEPRSLPDVTPLQGQALLDALRDRTFEANGALMHTFSTGSVFDRFLSQTRTEENPSRLMTFLRFFEDYHTYMTKDEKTALLDILSPLLRHPEEYLRRRAATVMGQILDNAGPAYRKEVPASAPPGVTAPSVLALLDEATALPYRAILSAHLPPELQDAPAPEEEDTPDALCRKVIANDSLPLALRRQCFQQELRQLLCILQELARDELDFFHRTALYNLLYHFLIYHEVVAGALPLPVTSS